MLTISLSLETNTDQAEYINKVIAAMHTFYGAVAERIRHRSLEQKVPTKIPRVEVTSQ